MTVNPWAQITSVAPGFLPRSISAAQTAFDLEADQEWDEWLLPYNPLTVEFEVIKRNPDGSWTRGHGGTPARDHPRWALALPVHREEWAN